MPTDPIRLINGQKVWLELLVEDDAPNWKPNVKFEVNGVVFYAPRTDILTDWPPEPSADEDGWETESTFRCVDPDLHSFFVEPNMGFQYRIQRRPIAPKWVPTVGEDAVWNAPMNMLETVTVNYIGNVTAHVTVKRGGEHIAMLSSLTQPKEQPRETP